jgi:hypothetical protein
MKRFYIGIFIFQTLVYGALFILAKYDTGAFTHEGRKIVPVLSVVFYIFSVSVTVFYPLLLNKIRNL